MAAQMKRESVPDPDVLRHDPGRSQRDRFVLRWRLPLPVGAVPPGSKFWG
jgi:hypothetical protein